jgi:2,3-bisphosphoglycerate-independent phosphoglycerate mutase
MYRGLAKLVGMTTLPGGHSFQDELDTLRKHWNDFDFFFIHYKYTDSAGEDGSFERKVKAIEDLDAFIPQIMELEPDVMMIAGDHSTPSALAAHSWHPVPFALHSKWARPDLADGFNERECFRGSLGNIPARVVMSLAMAHAQRFAKYGA